VHRIDCPLVLAMQENGKLLSDLLALRLNRSLKQILLRVL
jgi:hypothetical protein